ncbi:hypothetical protein MesoLj113c_37660 [Mesorhizobium sp. 113-3-9]|nr:hypothetical protein MesoLj113c_37660 [Mesorhizobium sp. 113-3-9]
MPIFTGYILGAVGWPGLAWIALDASDPPKRMSAGVVCSITYWDLAAGDCGYRDIETDYARAIIATAPPGTG